MDFSQLNYFRAAARHGNLTRAAEELYISQPGLSRYLSRLEEELGVPLFERRKGKITLNTYGQLFLANVNLAFDQLEQGWRQCAKCTPRTRMCCPWPVPSRIFSSTV